MITATEAKKLSDAGEKALHDRLTRELIKNIETYIKRDAAGGARAVRYDIGSILLPVVEQTRQVLKDAGYSSAVEHNTLVVSW